MVMWDPVPEFNRRGIVRAYDITIRPDLPLWPVQSFIDTNGNMFKEIGGLQPYTNYSIVMAAKTVAWGNFSEPVLIITGEGGKTQLTLTSEFYFKIE